MPNNAHINNQIDRRTAIFKAIGIYLLTLLCLLLIFFTNRDFDKANEALIEKNEGLIAEIQALKQVLIKLDTISTLSRNLVHLDEANRNEPGSKIGEIDRLKIIRTEFYEDIRKITKSEKFQLEDKSANNIYDVFCNLNEKIAILREGIVNAENSSEIDVQNQGNQLQQEINRLQSQNSDLTSQLQDANRKKENAETQKQEAEGKVRDAKGRVRDLNDFVISNSPALCGGYKNNISLRIQSIMDNM